MDGGEKYPAAASKEIKTNLMRSARNMIIHGGTDRQRGGAEG